jgi:hypothetical protein
MALDDSFVSSIAEDCPNCGNSLRHNIVTKNRMDDPPLQSRESPAFQTAYEVKPNSLLFGVAQMDRFLTLSEGDSVCIVGSGRYANLLVTRLCVHALMSKQYGGFESPVVEYADAGNSFGVYQCANFARQYGLDVKKILQRIAVRRPFTPHQLAELIINQLPVSAQQFGTKLIVISDLLRLFMADPHFDFEEANWLIKEIVRAVRKKFAHITVVISMHQVFPSRYDEGILPSFKNRIEIATEKGTARSRKLTTILHNSQGQTSQLQLHERDLCIVSPLR